MALDNILTDGDTVKFETAIANGLVTLTLLGPAPVIKGTGKTTIKSKPVCVDGDEASVVVDCTYITQVHDQFGTGKLMISELVDQHATKTKSGGKALLVKGGAFKSEFKVIGKAVNTKGPAPVPDSGTSYAGTGSFEPSNNNVKST